MAGSDLGGVGLLVQPAPTLDLNEFEVLDGVRHVNPAPIDTGLQQSGIQQLACWANEGMPGPILLIAGLLPDKHHVCRLGSFPEHSLRRVHPEIAPATTGGGFPEFWKRRLRRNEVGG